MVKKIVWTKRSIRKFNAIIDYLEKEWGTKVAEHFVKRTYDIIELISDYPEIGTLENAQRAIRGSVYPSTTGFFIGLPIRA